jgi:hypothetical protein
MFRQADLSQFFLGNSGPLKRQNEQRTQYFRDYEKSKRFSLDNFKRNGNKTVQLYRLVFLTVYFVDNSVSF